MVEITFFEVLIAYSALVLTIIGALVGFIMWHFVPLKSDVAVLDQKIDFIGEMVDETRERQTRMAEIVLGGDDDEEDMIDIADDTHFDK